MPRRRARIALLILVPAACAAAALAVLPELRRTIGFDRIHPGYEWLHQGLEEADQVARRAAAGSRRGAIAASAQLLERTIRYSKANAARAGTEPIPPHVRTALEPYFPESILDRVRWTFAGTNVDLGSAVATWYGREGGAVTLDYIIVFSDSRTANNLVLWAHELTHVIQYEQLGLEGFARVYTVNHRLIEQQAWRNSYRIAARLRRPRESEAGGKGRR